MSFLGDLWDDFRGKTGADAAREAADVQVQLQREGLDLLRPFFSDSAQNLEGVNQDATIGGFGQNIGDILNSGYLAPLLQQAHRAADFQLSKAGLRRSGAAADAAARIPVDFALSIESELNRRKQNNAGRAFGATQQAGNVLGNIGGMQAGGIIGAANARQQGTSNIIGLLRQVGQAFAASDERLKDNIEAIDSYGGLDVIRWRWNDAALLEYGLTGEGVGFSAQQVRAKYPKHTMINENGHLEICYSSLIDEIKANDNIH